LSVFVTDPSGKIIQTNMPSGVFGHFLGWASLDWLGSSAFSQGGGFFPVKNKDDTSTVIYVPINQTGTYTLLAHSTLFGGSSTTEPITLAAKFTNISPEMTDFIESSDVEIKPVPAEPEDIFEITAELKTQDQIKSDSDLQFNVGIAVGIVIGISIGLVFILISRQKSSK
ncbi:MAG: peptidase S8, partial [Nitrosopumilus sp.]|nr:peptidase S8 [Nitrosopumilus sp.]